MHIQQLSIEHKESIKEIIVDAFTPEPWCDRWDDPLQLDRYILDLIGNRNSLSLGLFCNDTLIGVSLGRIKHWYAGNEYWIDDLAITPSAQGHGCGKAFLNLMDAYLCKMDVHSIVLFTDRDTPAFHLYPKMGFFEEPERVFYRKDLR